KHRYRLHSELVQGVDEFRGPSTATAMPVSWRNAYTEMPCDQWPHMRRDAVGKVGSGADDDRLFDFGIAFAGDEGTDRLIGVGGKHRYTIAAEDHRAGIARPGMIVRVAVEGCEVKTDFLGNFARHVEIDINPAVHEIVRLERAGSEVNTPGIG